MTVPPPRVVVFDLDDTLADTAGTLLAPAEREAVAAMVAAGLRAAEGPALAALTALRTAEPGAPFCERLVERFGAPDPAACVLAGRQAFFGRDPAGIALCPGARETIDALRRRGIGVHLLTFGVPAAQERKVDLLGLRPLLSGIRIVPLAAGADKREALRALLAEAGVPPAEAWVVGDRPPGEIRAGRALGAFTVRVRRGEFARLEPAGPEEEADRTIASLPELLPLLP